MLLQKQKYRLASDVLISPHHGSKASSTACFIKAVGAKYTIFTAGYLNSFKHLKPLIMNRYELAGSQLYRSDYHGAIILHFMHDQPLQGNAWRLTHVKYWHDKYL